MTTKKMILTLGILPLFIACGGGSSSSDNTESSERGERTGTPETGETTGTALISKVKIAGTVPGTLIEAFCENGDYVQVTSTNNGTAKHPFELNIPKNINCKLVMTTNENDPVNRVITNIGFVNGGTQGTTLKVDADINIGNVPLALSYGDINDSNNDHVSDDLLYVAHEQVSVSTTSVADKDNDGVIDAYNDHDNDNIVNAYEDDDNDGVANIHDDDDKNDRPDYIDDDDNDGVINHNDDNDNNGRPDYAEDNDGDGIANHIDSDDDGNGIDDELESNDNNYNENNEMNENNERDGEDNDRDN